MRLHSDVDDFLADPIGSQLVTKHFAYWYPHAHMTGFALWESPDEQVIKQLNRVMDVVLSSRVQHISLVDMGLLRGADPTAFRAMAEYLASRWEAFGERIAKQALVRPRGFAGAVVAGFYEVVTPSFPVHVCSALEEALAWLDIAAEPDVCAAVLASREAAQHTHPFVRELRLTLRTETWSADLPAIARKLGVSVRTLQRRLTQLDTTFQSEVQSARLEAAQSMLTEGVNLTRIAQELGFCSLQHFSTLFRKHYGQSPRAWLKLRDSAGLHPTER
jgi:AraC-like DNA-binding protein